METKNINTKIHYILSFLYQLRTMSYTQIATYLLRQSSTSYCNKLIKSMVADKLIEKQGFYLADSYYFITTHGISKLKKFGILPICQSDNEPFYPDKFLTASKIKMDEKIVNHQLSLNEFVLRFRDNYSFPFSYYDEKYVSQIFSDMRPDGLLKINDNYYFLEMDMCSERKNSLIEKWQNYRSFLRSQDSYKVNGTIKVLFILGGKNNAFSSRTKNLTHYIMDNLWDLINRKSDFYIGSFEVLYPLIVSPNFHVDILKKYGFQINRGQFSDPGLSDYDFDYYICKTNDSGQIMVDNGVPVEFVVDDYTSESLFVLKKIHTFPSFAAVFQNLSARDIKYLLLVNSVDDAYRLIKNNEIPLDGIYFTTKKRLCDDSFYSAVFSIHKDGSVYHFADGNFLYPVKESTFSVFS